MAKHALHSLTELERAELRQLYGQLGERRFCDVTGLTSYATARLFGGLRVHDGTSALARAGIAAARRALDAHAGDGAALSNPTPPAAA